MEVFKLRLEHPPDELVKFSQLKSLTKLTDEVFNTLSKGDYTKKERDEKVKAFKEYNWINWLKIAKSLVIKSSEHNVVGFRDYNPFVMLPLRCIEQIGDWLGLETREFDISSAYPRLLYGYNNLDLPDDFYGKGKYKKLTINTALNSLADERMCPDRIINDLISMFDIHPMVAEFLGRNFVGNGDKGYLFNFLAYLEQDLISKANYEVEMVYMMRGVEFYNIRRHDSVLFFVKDGSPEIGKITLQHFEYLNRIGWF